MAVEGFRTLGERWGQALALGSLAGLADMQGDHGRAVAFADEALRHLRELGAVEELCDLYCDRGHYRVRLARQRPTGVTQFVMVNGCSASCIAQIPQVHRFYVFNNGLLPDVDIASGDTAAVAGAAAEVDPDIARGIDKGGNILLAVQGDITGGVHQQFAGCEALELGSIGQLNVAPHKQAHRPGAR